MPSTLRAVLLLLLISLTGRTALAAETAGAPPNAGHAVGAQKEKDWIDNRWSRTEVGPFLSSLLDTPAGAGVMAGAVGGTSGAVVSSGFGVAGSRSVVTLGGGTGTGSATGVTAGDGLGNSGSGGSGLPRGGTGSAFGTSALSGSGSAAEIGRTPSPLAENSFGLGGAGAGDAGAAGEPDSA